MMRTLLVAAVLLALAAPAAAADTIDVNGSSGGRTFDGIGGLSAGASSRLLYDYHEPERSQILDYLFKPDYGAAGQILKVEIGGDTNSTDGAEASHERTRGDVHCGRGYEWWLMREAKSRNPNIKLWALEWGAPGWLDGGFWSQDNIDYLLAWLDCARSQGLTIDYVGGWNERGFDADWYIAWDRALAARYPDVKIVAADAISDKWAVASAMRRNPAFDAAVDIVGVHDPCTQRSLYQRCPSTADALALDKPLWDSEQSSEGHDVGAEPLARAMNRQYIDGRMTANVNWALISAWYADLPIADTGLLLAENPWSGHYRVGKSIWVHAHTAQFTQPGWRYLDSGSGYTAGGASYVTLRAPSGGDWSTVIETMDSTQPETVDVAVSGGLSEGPLQLWSSDLRSSDPADMFVHSGDVEASGGHVTLSLEPGHVYTLSSTTGQHKGTARPAAGMGERMRLPWREDFEHVGADGARGRSAPGRLARYFSDLNGAFETASCGAGRQGTCYRQVVERKPIAWNGTGSLAPTTVAGDPRWWGDYEVRARVRLAAPGSVQLLGRVDAQKGTRVSGYHLEVSDTGEWRLFAQDLIGPDAELASGRVPFGAGEWHRLALRFRGAGIGVRIDGHRVAKVRDTRHLTGQIGLGTGDFSPAEFDDVSVTPSGPAPRLVPHAGMTATATSAHTANYRGYEYSAPNAIDDRPETMWNSEFSPLAPLPQAITLDLGRPRDVRALTYQPRLDGTPSGMVTGYAVELSADGQAFEQVAHGGWGVSTGTKVATWSPRKARYVRLVATRAAGCPASAAAAELNIVDGAGPALPATPDDGPDAGFDRVIPRGEMTVTASSRYSDAYLPAYAIDGDCRTFWHSAPGATKPLPATLTLDLGGEHAVNGITYLPRQDGNGNGLITGYEVSVSTDGSAFRPVASGAWPADATRKTVRFPAVDATHVRLTATAGTAGVASVAELEVADAGP